MPRVVVVALVFAAHGCKEPPPECMVVDTECSPLYTPTFDNVYNMTIVKGCGIDRSSCHSPTGESGTSFATIESAYADLTASGLVKPLDPSCSEFVVRTNSPGKDYQMPPGDALSAATRCALIKWVEAGAPGPGQPAPRVP
ncbi:MAG: hypothetical protein AB7O24_05340 [Kofleriaceae bacterium]